MTRWLRKNAEAVTAVCIVLSLVLGGALVYILRLPT